MIKHLVFWRLQEEALGQPKAVNAQRMREQLEGLRGRIPGLLAIEVGIDFSAGPASSDVALYSEFTDRAALQHYQAHPLHQEVVAFVAQVQAERRMVDYEVPDRASAGAL